MISKKRLPARLSAILKSNLKRNKKDYQRLADHIGLLPLVMVSPYDISIIIEGSEERQKIC